MIAAIRRWLDERGFLEVETPVLQPLYGGALARPFTTHHNALDRDLYLRIAAELYLKRLIVGGLERVYEIGKNFRNEGLSHKHNPEFTMLEWYEAYADYGDIAAELEQLVVVRGGRGRLRRRARLHARRGGGSRCATRSARRPASTCSSTATATRCSRPRASRGSSSTARPPGRSSSTTCSPSTSSRSSSSPPSSSTTRSSCRRSPRSHRSEPGLVERFECFAGGMEFANAFTELNDPDEQRARFEEQKRQTAAGDEETQPYDEDFVRALEHGMPPTGGIGVGLDRLVMILSGRTSIREVVLFPAMRSLDRRIRSERLRRSRSRKSQRRAVGRLDSRCRAQPEPSSLSANAE